MRGTAALSPDVVAACRAGAIRDATKSGDGFHGPDEFAILPTKPLEMPADVAALPPPTPGAANRADPSRAPTPTRRSAATPRC